MLLNTMHTNPMAMVMDIMDMKNLHLLKTTLKKFFKTYEKKEIALGSRKADCNPNNRRNGTYKKEIDSLELNETGIITWEESKFKVYHGHLHKLHNNIAKEGALSLKKHLGPWQSQEKLVDS
ncbi:hypothetical protein PIB30_033266 [Stylosanthes scabra]|uniref:Uncharacterized protein n=1 Tax=Stylosanthes scabra TaxID=79078 RepID=A0ABU6YB72_9FABA|nr:hypothetical protein [Stylosanthes scabra]